MHLAFRWILLAIILTLPVQHGAACTCSARVSSPSVRMLAEIDAFFLGQAVQDVPMLDKGTTTTGTVFEVIESFKGSVSPRARVLVHGGFWPDLCSHRAFAIGSIYLVQAMRIPAAVPSHPQLSRDVWRTGVQRTTYLSGVCHGSRPVSGAEQDIRMLREWNGGDRVP